MHFSPIPALAGLVFIGGACWFYSLDPPFWNQILKDLFHRG